MIPVAKIYVLHLLLILASLLPERGKGENPYGAQRRFLQEPPEFEWDTVAEIARPVDLEFTPDGELLFVTAKSGILFVIQDYEGDSPIVTKALDISSITCDNFERGLTSVTVHPDYPVNRYIYLMYNFNKFSNDCPKDPEDGPVIRVSRFVLSQDNTIDMSTEEPFVESPPLPGSVHQSGSMKFGKDGLLYIGFGDGVNKSAESQSQNRSSLFGKLMRLTDDGKIPSDNPFVNYPNRLRCNETGVPPAGSPSGAVCEEIYSSGLRNPWSLAMDPNSDEVLCYIGDVGAGTWEEINVGCGSDFAGADYGWPVREGPCKIHRTDTSECQRDGRFVEPIHWFQHVQTSKGNEGAVTGVTVVPNGFLPAPFDGAVLYCDFPFSKMYHMKAGDEECRSCSPVTSDYESAVLVGDTEFGKVSRMAFGGDRALYYTIPVDERELRRLRIVSANNHRPDASFTASQLSGPKGVTIDFDASNSFDPDGDQLSFAWDFNDDGTVDSTEKTSSYTYLNVGLFTVTLTVTDEMGLDHTADVDISIGNNPVPTIESPSDGLTWAVGDVLVLSGSAEDNEDGVLPDTSLTWVVRKHHANHFHSYLDETIGNNIALLSTPSPEDLLAANNTYLEIILTATDSDGLTSTVSRNVFPKIVTFSVDSEPSGLTLVFDNFPVSTPTTIQSWENNALLMSAPDQERESDGEFYFWKSWWDNGSQNHTIVVPPSGPSVPRIVAFFEKSIGATIGGTNSRPPPVSTPIPSPTGGTIGGFRSAASFEKSGGKTVGGTTIGVLVLSLLCFMH